MRRWCVPLAVSVVACLVSGCMSRAVSPKLGLQRALYPGLGDLDVSEISTAFGTEVRLEPPLAGGVVWLDDAGSRNWGPVLSEFSRTGILKQAIESLLHSPFGRVAALPTTTNDSKTDRHPGPLGHRPRLGHEGRLLLPSALIRQRVLL